MVNQKFMQENPDFDIADSYDNEEFSDPVFIPENAGSREITLRKQYPMFNFDYYLSHITPHGLAIDDDRSFSFEISDDMDYLCHLVGDVKPDLSIRDWNNG